MGEHDKPGTCEMHLRSQCRLGTHPWKLQVPDPAFFLCFFSVLLADLPNESDKKQNALNMPWTLSSGNLILNSRSQVDMCVQGWLRAWNSVRDHLYHTFHSDDCPIFLKKKKKAKLGHLIQSAGTGAFGPKALCILHLLRGCPILKGIKHSSLQLSPWHQATVQTGMQKPKPENKRRLTAQSTELGRNCQDR